MNNLEMIGFYKYGGIHIKPENRGKFTKSAKAAGKSVQEHARDVLADPNATPLLKKRANFARNSRKWKHLKGGELLGKTYNGETIPEVLIVPQYKATLNTYYPVISKYPFTGHSSLRLSEAEKKDGLYTGRYKNVGDVDLRSQSPKYRFVRNNCSNATGKCLSETFGIPIDTFLFTTPGDVRDYFIDRGATEDLKRKRSIKLRLDKGLKVSKALLGYDTHTKYLSPELGNKMKDYLMTNQGLDNGITISKGYLNGL